jgi:hypothetical protein
LFKQLKASVGEFIGDDELESTAADVTANSKSRCADMSQGVGSIDLNAEGDIEHELSDDGIDEDDCSDDGDTVGGNEALDVDCE